MTTEQPLKLDVTSDEFISKIGSSAPVLSSQKGFWNGVRVSYYKYHNALETPEHCFSQHLITIHLNHAVAIKEQLLNGHLRCDRFRNGDICLTPATTPVSVRLQDASEWIALHLEPTFIEQIADEVADPDRLDIIPQFKLNDPLIYQIGIALKVNLESENAYGRLYTESMATALSAHLLQHYSTKKPKIESYSDGLSQARLRQVTEYIHQHSAQNPSLMIMAEMVHISPYYFSRLFKQSTGLTPHQYLLKCRTNQAKRLLKTTNLLIADIAVQVGFVDQSHLNRHFKRHFGVSPGQFRA
ncbi:MAG: helix-turn-helix transcriptional regulator [Nostoc sp. NMS1]|uniref:AraC family transcriptional regulator n=1 Tax=unclassified Nostoc TaxID=2593658 RepID=UPI0025F5726B|nr:MULTISPECIES: AraC family transcriptional regulator [unclassified Nostoc]MBN3906547.1 helix-turn-helix transcriptional regulator [Nostoc sp. NMS1]MBN3993068.1 helix-turn-helix transcriptional regulator [Nostoc sp. NMS2]